MLPPASAPSGAYRLPLSRRGGEPVGVEVGKGFADVGFGGLPFAVGEGEGDEGALRGGGDDAGHLYGGCQLVARADEGDLHGDGVACGCIYRFTCHFSCTYIDGRCRAFQPGFDAGDAFGVASGDGEFELHPAEKLAHGQADAHGVVGYDGGDGGAAEKHSGVGALQAAVGGGTGYGGGAVGDAYAFGQVVAQQGYVARGKECGDGRLLYLQDEGGTCRLDGVAGGDGDAFATLCPVGGEDDRALAGGRGVVQVVLDAGGKCCGGQHQDADGRVGCVEYLHCLFPPIFHISVMAALLMPQ